MTKPSGAGPGHCLLFLRQIAKEGVLSKVAVIMGSRSDASIMSAAFSTLNELGLSFEVRVLSAHRAPRALIEYVDSLPERGCRVIIAAAGGAAHLPGVIAGLTDLPVIGVPIPTKMMGGLDSLLSIVQMPGGVPVATMATDRAGAKNSALYAARILALSDTELAGRLAEYNRKQTDKVVSQQIFGSDEIAASET